jgi:hypothetical protein
VSKRSTRVAWSLLGAYTAGVGATVVLAVADGRLQRDWQGLIAQTLAFAAYSVIGALIVARRPDNAMGWLFSAIGLLAATMLVAGEYAQYAYVTRPRPLPGAIVAAWLPPTAVYALYLSTVILPLLLFPTGRPLSPRWRPVLWITGAEVVGLTVLAGTHPELLLADGNHVIANPLAFAGADLPRAGQVDWVIFVPVTAALVSMLIRYRRARGDERQQLKWFAYGAALTVVLAMTGRLPFPRADTLSSALTLGLLPVAAGVAILRYRLYDIDRLINRTLVYGALTALLGAVYAAAVLVLGQLFGGVGGDPPSWAVAGATLAVAALFQPARGRTQAVVDRRFNRRKYDAAKTIQAFSTRLRDQIDLDTVSTELLAVIDQAMEPTQASLWLRPSANGSPGTAGSEATPTSWAY